MNGILGIQKRDRTGLQKAMTSRSAHFLKGALVSFALSTILFPHSALAESDSDTATSTTSLTAPALQRSRARAGWFGTFELRADQAVARADSGRQNGPSPTSLFGAEFGHRLGQRSLYVGALVQYRTLVPTSANASAGRESLPASRRFEDAYLNIGNSSAWEGADLGLAPEARGGYEFSFILPTSDYSIRAGTRFGVRANSSVVIPVRTSTLLLSTDLYAYSQRYTTADVAGDFSNDLLIQEFRAVLTVPVAPRRAPGLTWSLDPRLSTLVSHSGKVTSSYALLTGPNFEFMPTWMLALRAIAQDRVYSSQAFTQTEHFSFRLSLVKWI